MEFTTPNLWAAFSNNPTLGVNNKFVCAASRDCRQEGLPPLTHTVDGIVTLHDPPFQRSWTLWRAQFAMLPPKATIRRSYVPPPLERGLQGSSDFKLELFPFHSPLLRESSLVSFPPLIDMLKFSG